MPFFLNQEKRRVKSHHLSLCPKGRWAWEGNVPESSDSVNNLNLAFMAYPVIQHPFWGLRCTRRSLDIKVKVPPFLSPFPRAVTPNLCDQKL